MARAASAERWKTNSVCLLSGKIIPQLQEKTQRQLEQSDLVPDTKVRKKCKPTPVLRPLIYCSSSCVYSSSSRLARGRGHTHWLGELKTTDSRFFIFRNVLTGDTNSGSSSGTAATLHKKNMIL